jgi:hypothetical protein
VRRAWQVTVLADASKLSASQLPAWLPLEPGWGLVTDAAADPAALGRMRDGGVDVVVGGERRARVCGGLSDVCGGQRWSIRPGSRRSPRRRLRL